MSCCPGSGPGCTAPTRTPSPARQLTSRRWPRGLPRSWPSTGIGPRQPAEALDWSVRAADSAERVYAHVGGGPPLRTGVGAVGTGARRRAAPTSTGSACTRGRRGPGSMPVTRPGRCRTSRRRYGRWTRPPTRSGPACCTIPRLVRRRNDRPGDRARRQPGGGPAGSGGAAVRRARPGAAGLRPCPAHSAGRHDEAAAVHEQALTAARRAGSQPDIVQAMASVGYLRAVAGQVDAGVALLREALRA